MTFVKLTQPTTGFSTTNLIPSNGYAVNINTRISPFTAVTSTPAVNPWLLEVAAPTTWSTKVNPG